ncbi:hypothetical protein L1987_78391 [Smallanthus sonchifolius]|uniref:Uncharacterized protein n=1 Tax=Smallanthus sonchifolius TaxID=185202 RepID=A0ACB8ZDJ7_9ASTR|nr:hypothetical protein L1987_78391 [Smallanthus sonchifolius]
MISKQQTKLGLTKSLHTRSYTTSQKFRFDAVEVIMSLAIRGDSVVLKFEKAKSAPEDSLTWVEDMVPQTIGSQAYLAIDTPDYIALEVLLKKAYSLECVVYEYSIMYVYMIRSLKLFKSVHAY